MAGMNRKKKEIIILRSPVQDLRLKMLINLFGLGQMQAILQEGLVNVTANQGLTDILFC